jgi:hypothetical protein
MAPARRERAGDGGYGILKLPVRMLLDLVFKSYPERATKTDNAGAIIFSQVQLRRCTVTQ